MICSKDVGSKMVDMLFIPILSMVCRASRSKVVHGCFPVDVPQLMYLAASGLAHRLTKSHWRWCFFESSIGGASTSIPACAMSPLEFGGGS
jgi:hypothetical protein